MRKDVESKISSWPHPCTMNGYQRKSILLLDRLYQLRLIGSGWITAQEKSRSSYCNENRSCDAIGASFCLT
jgi:hypothetical protein